MSARKLGLDEAERALRTKYSQVVPGTLKEVGTAGFPLKRSVEIRCRRRKCKKTRRCATSDVFQIHYCSDECKDIAKSH